MSRTMPPPRTHRVGLGVRAAHATIKPRKSASPPPNEGGLSTKIWLDQLKKQNNAKHGGEWA